MNGELHINFGEQLFAKNWSDTFFFVNRTRINFKINVSFGEKMKKKATKHDKVLSFNNNLQIKTPFGSAQ